MDVPVTVDRFLTEFFAELRRGTSGERRFHLDRTEVDLRLAVELAELDALDALLVAAERQFEPIAAVARVLPVTMLPVVLEAYLTDPLYRPTDRQEARTRLDACAALIRRLAGERELLPVTRVLRRLDERVRMEAATLQPSRRLLRGRRVRG